MIIFRTPEKTSEIALSIFFYRVIGQTIQSLIQFLNSLFGKGFRLTVQKLDIFFCFITPVTSWRHGKRFLVKCYLERLCYLTLIIFNYFSYEIKQAPVALELILCSLVFVISCFFVKEVFLTFKKFYRKALDDTSLAVAFRKFKSRNKLKRLLQ